MPDPSQLSLDQSLRHYLGVLRRRLGIIIVATVLVAAAAYGAARLQTPVYSASAELLFQPPPGSAVFGGQTVNDAAQIPTQIELLTSQPVRAAVYAKLRNPSPITAHQVAGTDLIRVSSESTDPARAATTVNTYAEAYIEVHRQQTVNALLQATTPLQQKIDSLGQQIAGLQSQIDAADPKIRAFVQASLAPQIDPLVTERNTYSQQLNQLQLQASVQTGGASVTTPAAPATTPIKPTPKRDALEGIAIGLVLGTATAFGVDYLDDAVRSRDDLEGWQGVPLLGVVPAMAHARPGPKALVATDKPGTAPAEAYRSLRTAIDFVSLDERRQVIQITSPVAQEGKTTTAANLALTMAQTGRRVIVVCCDLRRPKLFQYYGLNNEVGFTSVVLGQATLMEALQPVPGHDGIRLLASGPVPPNPSELLASGRTRDLFASLRAHADVVIVDSPPLLPVTDAAVLTAVSDGVAVVVSSGRTTRRALRQATELLRQVDAPLLGFILNRVSDRGGYGYRYGYRYGYGYGTSYRPTDTSKRRRLRRRSDTAAPDSGSDTQTPSVA